MSTGRMSLSESADPDCPTAIVVYTHIVGMAVIRALGEAGIPVVAFHYDDNEVGYHSRYVRESIRVPSLRLDEAAFVKRALELGERFPGALLIPTDDYSLATLSRHKKELSSRYVVAADEWQRVSQCIDKQHMYERSHALGISAPVTFVVRSEEELKSRSAEVRFPCLLKPTQGHRFQDRFGVKMFRIDDGQQLRARYEQASTTGIELMLQELIPGPDSAGVNYNSYFVDGNPVAEFTAQKLRLEPPFFGSPRVIVSKMIPEIVEPGRVLLRELNYTGFSCMEFKRDSRNGKYTFMEINCRNNRSGSLAVRCGINFPLIMYRHLVENQIAPAEGFREGVAWIEGTSDLIRFFASRSEERYTLREYLRPYLQERVFAFLSFRDPMPFLKRTSFLMRSAFRRRKNQIYRRGSDVLASRQQMVK